MSTLATFIQHSFGSPSHGDLKRKRNRRNPNWRRRSKTVTACYLLLYIENPKDGTRIELELYLLLYYYLLLYIENPKDGTRI